MFESEVLDDGVKVVQVQGLTHLGRCALEVNQINGADCQRLELLEVLEWFSYFNPGLSSLTPIHTLIALIC